MNYCVEAHELQFHTTSGNLSLKSKNQFMYKISSKRALQKNLFVQFYCCDYYLFSYFQGTEIYTVDKIACAILLHIYQVNKIILKSDVRNVYILLTKKKYGTEISADKMSKSRC